MATNIPIYPNTIEETCNGYLAIFNQVTVPGNGYGNANVALTREQIEIILRNSPEVFLGQLAAVAHKLNTVVFPMELTDKVYHERNYLRMEKLHPILRPSQGNIRVGKQIRRHVEAKMENYNLAFEIEGEVWSGKYGSKIFAEHMQSVVDGMINHNANAVYKALLTCNKKERVLPRSDHEWYNYLEQVAHETFRAHKGELGLKELNQICMMRMYNGESGKMPDKMVVPPGRLGLAIRGSKTMYEYRIAGEKGVEGVNGNGIVESMNGLDIIEAPFERTFHNGDPITISHLLYTADGMMLYQRKGVNTNEAPEVEMFNCVADAERPLNVADNLNGTGRFDSDDQNKWRMLGNGTVEDYNKLCDRFGDAEFFNNVIENNNDPFLMPLYDVTGKNIIGCMIRKDTGTKSNLGQQQQQAYQDLLTEPNQANATILTNLMTNGVVAAAAGNGTAAVAAEAKSGDNYDPFCLVSHDDIWWSKCKQFLDLRLCREANTQSNVYVKAGSDAGNTLHDQSYFDAEKDTQKRFWKFTNDYRMGVIVNDPDLIVVAENCFHDQLSTGNPVGNGSNVSIMTWQQARELARNNYVLTNPLQACIHAICLPLKTVVAQALPGVEERTFPLFKFDAPALNASGAFQNVNSSDPHYPGHKFVSELFGFNKIAQRPDYGTVDLPIDLNFYQASGRYMTSSGVYVRIPGTGHYGAHEITGHKDVRCYGATIYPEVKESNN